MVVKEHLGARSIRQLGVVFCSCLLRCAASSEPGARGVAVPVLTGGSLEEDFLQGAASLLGLHPKSFHGSFFLSEPCVVVNAQGSLRSSCRESCGLALAGEVCPHTPVSH